MNTIPKMVKKWFANAHEDLRAANILHRISPEKYLRIVPYHCQQTAENSIKGFLAYKKINFKKSHDIKELAKLMLPITPGLESLLKKADELTIFAIEFRYPDAAKRPLTVEDSVEALKIAQEIFDAVVALIPFENSFDI